MNHDDNLRIHGLKATLPRMKVLDVLREAPLKWFVAVHLILPQLSRLEDLHITLVGAKKRALSRVSVHPFFSTSLSVLWYCSQGSRCI